MVIDLKSHLLGVGTGLLLGLGLFLNTHIDNTNSIISPNVLIYREIGSFDFAIEAEDYFDYRRKRNSPLRDKDYAKYVTYNDPNIQSLAEEITEFSETNEDKAGDLLYLVNFYGVYSSDSDLYLDNASYTEYARYPVETLVETNGDCEDAAILYASLAKAVDLDVILINLDHKIKDNGHMIVGVAGDFEGKYVEYHGKKYFLADATFCANKYKCGTPIIGNFYSGEVSDWEFKVIPID